MKISIIDIGTKSIKHYVFEDKKEIYFERNSDVNLGKNVLKTNILEEENIQKAISYLKFCINTNNQYNVDKTIVTGTDALRRADNSKDFIDLVKQVSGLDIEIISHKEEADLLGKAYDNLIEEDFGVVNVGGGSTELFISKFNKPYTFELPFGVNKIRQEFLLDKYSQGIYNDKESWGQVKDFLIKTIKEIIPEDLSVENLFLNGVLNFAQKQKSLVNFEFKICDIKNHPIKTDLQSYIQFNELLKDVGVEKLAENYSYDPYYAENFAIGQEVYINIAKYLKVKKVYPDEIQYIYGLIQ